MKHAFPSTWPPASALSPGPTTISQICASRAVEWCGAILGLVGAAMNAVAVPELAIPAYLTWVISSTLLTCFGWATRSFGIMVMSIGYTALNLMGVMTRL